MQKAVINYINFTVKIYHDEISAKVGYHLNGDYHESQLYSLVEIGNLIALWKAGKLLGSFAVDTILADNAIIAYIDGGKI